MQSLPFSQEPFSSTVPGGAQSVVPSSASQMHAFVPQATFPLKRSHLIVQTLAFGTGVPAESFCALHMPRPLPLHATLGAEQ